MAPTVLQRSSSSELSSRCERARGSSKTRTAVSKRTSCLRRFWRFLCSSQVKRMARRDQTVYPSRAEMSIYLYVQGLRPRNRDMAERVGFEPTGPVLPGHPLSRRALSTTQTPLRAAGYEKSVSDAVRSDKTLLDLSPIHKPPAFHARAAPRREPRGMEGVARVASGQAPRRITIQAQLQGTSAGAANETR